MNIVQEKENGNLKATYHRAGNQIISSDIGGSNNFYIYNGQGNVTKILNSSYETVADYTFDAFGVQKNVNGDIYNPFRHNGEYYDEELGYTYLRNRYYDNNTGRFVTEDPIKDGLNWYSYCANNPIGFVDPTGLCEKCFGNYEDYQNFCQQEDAAFENEIMKNTNSSQAINIVQNNGVINIYAYVKIEKSSLSTENIVDSIVKN